MVETTKTVTTTQAAAILGVSRATVVRFCGEGRLPYAQPGTHRLLRLADVLEFKAATTHTTDEECHVTETGQASRSIVQLREEVLNARECGDAFIEVRAADLDAALSEVGRLNASNAEKDDASARLYAENLRLRTLLAEFAPSFAARDGAA
jgi:excisionase family DNA binding protein